MKKKVLLYLASNSVFYSNLYSSIKRGFEDAGCEVQGGDQLLDATALIQKIEQYQPDFVFEMNRVKSEIKGFPKDVIHICWLVDFWGRLHEDLGGSDLLYVYSSDWIKYFKEVEIHSVFYLPPATDATIYHPLMKVEKIHDFIFLGHISKHWTKKELDRVVGRYNGEVMLFRNLLPHVEEYVLSKRCKPTLVDFLKSRDIACTDPIDATLRYDISSRVFRQTRREHFIDMFSEVTNNLAIYGSENWLLYEQYKNLYKGSISSFSEMNCAIGRANILLHDGNCPHFRTFDAMAAGVVVAAAQPPENFKNSWEYLGFMDGKNYLNIDLYDGSTVDMERFKKSRLLTEIAENARKKVLDKHLWVHRADKVLADISGL